jgi:hypothetical protein
MYLLKAMAADLANIIAHKTNKSNPQLIPAPVSRMPIKNPMNAKGRAKTVCENFIKDRYFPAALRTILFTAFI